VSSLDGPCAKATNSVVTQTVDSSARNGNGGIVVGRKSTVENVRRWSERSLGCIAAN